jgi:hypothetical protein
MKNPLISPNQCYEFDNISRLAIKRKCNNESLVINFLSIFRHNTTKTKTTVAAAAKNIIIKSAFLSSFRYVLYYDDDK